ncbi:MAG: glutamine--tRNA ligase/YqeY domain fusion protein [Trueperaceae bacterium]|nr:glutamine--tRNA ligase/YqeY domain fusion protein [Trueperaceae bacterium]
MEAEPKPSAPEPFAARAVAPNFITDIVDRDLASGRVANVVTRFPPEPNGYLHIGHAKAIQLDFGVARDYGGVTFLRYDDTNPVTEDPEYVAAIERDVRWLGYEWHAVRHASDYFPELYDHAVRLIEAGDAYVDSLDEEQIRDYRGTVTEAGRDSPFRGRSVAENLDLFARMRDGEFGPGEHVLRAKIDMSAANMKMRDPILYRIVDAAHYRTGNEWPIYPMYDFAHPLSDAIEGVSHSLCTLEFENNREVYDWVLDRLIEGPRPHQYEFARLVLDYTVVSKRKLIRLVQAGVVDSWDDPRMPTISALRRRGVRPEAIREFTNRVGVARANSRTDLALLDSSIRDDLNAVAPRVMAVLDPLKVVLTNVPAGSVTELDAPYWPPDVPGTGSRRVPLTRELYVERDDFAAVPPPGFKRLAPGRAVRLRHGPVIRVDEAVTGADGEVTELRAHMFAPGASDDLAGVKVWSAVHWVSAERGVPMTARLYDRLFTVPDPDGAEGDFLDHVNPRALEVVEGWIEPSVTADPPDRRYQFERLGYFWRDPVDGLTPDAPVFNRIVPLKDARSKAGSRSGGGRSAVGRAAAVPAHSQAPATEQAPAVAAAPDAALDAEARRRFATMTALQGVAEHDAAILATRADLFEFYAGAVAHGARPQGAANWVVNDVARALKATTEPRLTAVALAELVRLVDDGTITARSGRELLDEIVATGADPGALVAERGLARLGDDESLRAVVDDVVARHPAELEAYRAGKLGLAGFFVGQVMRRTSGRADPGAVKRLVAERLAG